MTPETPEQQAQRDLIELKLAEAKALGLTFGDCIRAFAASTPNELAYAEAGTLMASDKEIEVDDQTVVSMGDDPGAYVMAWIWVAESSVWDGPTDDDGAPCRFINHYVCEACNVSWVDEWSCACNDRCPDCNAEIEPRSSDELDLNGNVIKELDHSRAGIEPAPDA